MSWEDVFKVEANKKQILENLDKFSDQGYVPSEMLKQLDHTEIYEIVTKYNERIGLHKVKQKGTRYSDVLKSKMPRGWDEVFGDQEVLEELDNMQGVFESKSIKCTPDPVDVFNAYYLTPLENIKVVIIGQNPYHQRSSQGLVAMGLSFSARTCEPIPKSLKNIYGLGERDLGTNNFLSPDHPDLSIWAMRGVLMLNTALTSEVGNSKNLLQASWKFLLTKTLQAVHRHNPECVYMLWGRDAQEIDLPDDNANKVTAVHPSPFNGTEAFQNSKCFSKTNAILKGYGIDPINWNIPLRKNLEKEYALIKTKQQNFDEELLKEALNVDV
jgi:uracil-DNA glycosylase